MKKILQFIICLASVSLFAVEKVNIVATFKDGKVTTQEMIAKKIGKGVTQIKIPAKDIPDCKYLDVFTDAATANKGDEGFWILGRGEMGYFNKENADYTSPRPRMYLPYYAMKTPKETFIAIIDGLRFEFVINIKVRDGVYTMYPRWRIEKIGCAPYDDIIITFYKLGKKADYNKMAKTYRKHKFATNKNLKTMKQRFATQPHLKKMAMSLPVRLHMAFKKFDPKTDSIDFFPKGGKPFENPEYGVKAEKEEYKVHAYKFKNLAKTLVQMKEMGMDDIFVCVTGWQTGGYDSRCPTTFPVCEEAGGEKELRNLIKTGQDLGFIVDGHSNYTDAYTCSPEWSPDNVSKSADGKLEVNGAWSGGKAYNLCLVNAYEKFIKRDIDKIRDLGFNGAHFIDVFTAIYPYRCFDPKHYGNRKQVAELQGKIAQLCREKFGGFGSESGSDHFIDKVDYINYVTFHMRSKYVDKVKRKEFVDKFVPFWELVYHDIVLSNPDKITQEVLSQENNLRLVEFGGRPMFYSVKKKNIDEIKKAYEQFKTLRHLQIEEMLSHKELRENVFRIKYADGSVILVNRSDKPFSYKGTDVPAMQFKLFNPTSKNVN